MWFKQEMTTKQQVFLFILVGMLNTGFSYCCYACFLLLGLSYPLALLYTTIIGVFFNFKTTGKFVFRNSNNLLVFKFVTVYVCIYFFNMAFIGVLKHFSFDLYTAGFISLFPAAVLGFLLNKNLVFKA